MNKMNILCRCKPKVEIGELSLTKKFEDMLNNLGKYTDNDQKLKIEEMNGLIDTMKLKELAIISEKETFDQVEKMIKRKKLRLENALMLLKHLGYCVKFKYAYDTFLEYSPLCNRFETMKFNNVKKAKNEKLLIDVCECYLLLCNSCSMGDFFSMCISSLLKVAKRKEEDEETQKEAEMALMTLSHQNEYQSIEQKLYLNEIKEIIQYHQQHNNLTQLSYQSAWQFLIERLPQGSKLAKTTVNELHFVREATRGLNELIECVILKKNENAQENSKELRIMLRWLYSLDKGFSHCNLSCEDEFAALMECLIRLYRLARGYEFEIRGKCIKVFESLIGKGIALVSIFVKRGAIDMIFEEMRKQTLENSPIAHCLALFSVLSERLNRRKNEKCSKIELKKMKREAFDKLEENGYEDLILSVHEIYVCKTIRDGFIFLRKSSNYFIYL